MRIWYTRPNWLFKTCVIDLSNLCFNVFVNKSSIKISTCLLVFHSSKNHNSRECVAEYGFPFWIFNLSFCTMSEGKYCLLSKAFSPAFSTSIHFTRSYSNEHFVYGRHLAWSVKYFNLSILLLCQQLTNSVSKRIPLILIFSFGLYAVYRCRWQQLIFFRCPLFYYMSIAFRCARCSYVRMTVY